MITSPSGAASGTLPPFQFLAAPAEWDRIDFISDLHLDSTRPRTFQVWADFVRQTPAQALFILGDLFEAWIGDDVAAQPGFAADALSILREAAQTRWLGFMAGNRDFLFGSNQSDFCGIHFLNDPTVISAFGQRIMLSHGDLLCLGDVEYLRFRSLVRNPEWQSDFLAKPLQQRCAIAAAMRDASRKHQRMPESWVDVDTQTALEWLTHVQCSALVHGHTHRPGSEEMAPGIWRYVLTDWELDGLGPLRAQVLSLQREGFVRLDLPA
ncbi:UDP-2,3-diacylglucosamine diphosphatase [Azohydromonas lata]|uniref:UDP-2,3-diacylglucosamine diphosphatase n=1 Tax=Azohydromonas lata TaxID=45677 RepID=UPI0027D888FB|nr:UDP-2,3-diacylglucosamine diphosphatase [Azohydromonas lata]